jgi:RimJ/RimL family protein N-acetyltransferase
VSNAATTSGRRPAAAILSGRFEGRLAVVEPLAVKHGPALLSAAGAREVFQWLPEDLGASPQHLSDWLGRSIAAAQSGNEIPFAIVSTATGEAVGSTRFLEIRLEHLRVEIGWTWLHPSVWGRGINVETKLLLLTHAFERVGCRRVEFKTDARNIRSRSALEGIGAKFEGVFRKHMVLADRSPRDSAYYSVIDDEWPRVKQLLEQRLDRHAAAAAR